MTSLEAWNEFIRQDTYIYVPDCPEALVPPGPGAIKISREIIPANWTIVKDLKNADAHGQFDVQWRKVCERMDDGKALPPHLLKEAFDMVDKSLGQWMPRGIACRTFFRLATETKGLADFIMIRELKFSIAIRRA